MASKSRPYIAPAWQAAHLAVLPVGGKALLVVPCECQDWMRPCVGEDGIAHGYCCSGPEEGEGCPLGPVGSVVTVKSVGDFRIMSIDLRRSDSMTDLEALRWGTVAWAENPKRLWEQEYPKHPWGAWAWFVGAEKVER